MSLSILAKVDVNLFWYSSDRLTSLALVYGVPFVVKISNIRIWKYIQTTFFVFENGTFFVFGNGTFSYLKKRHFLYLKVTHFRIWNECIFVFEKDTFFLFEKDTFLFFQNAGFSYLQLVHFSYLKLAQFSYLKRRFGILELRNRVTQNDVTLWVTNSKLKKKTLHFELLIRSRKIKSYSTSY